MQDNPWARGTKVGTNTSGSKPKGKH